MSYPGTVLFDIIKEKQEAKIMGFAMRMNLNGEIIKKQSFQPMYINGKNQGFSFLVQLGYYRGHYLSTIEQLEVTVDGETIPKEAVTFELNKREMPIYRLKLATTEFWSQVVPARIHVIKPGGLSKGSHKIELKLMMRIPYMAIGPDHNYMPLDSGDIVEIEVTE